MLSYLWGGSKFTKEESDDFVEAMYSDLKAHGEFQMNFDGTMEFRDFLVLRSCISRQVARSLAEKKMQLINEQHEHFVKGEMGKYQQTMRKLPTIQQKRTQVFTKKACDFIDFDIEKYKQTVLNVTQDP